MWDVDDWEDDLLPVSLRKLPRPPFIDVTHSSCLRCHTCTLALVVLVGLPSIS